MHLVISIVEKIDQQTLNNQDNQYNTKEYHSLFTSYIILAAIIHKKYAFGSSNRDSFLCNELNLFAR